MKQHGFLFAVFGFLYLAWDRMTRRRGAWLSTLKDPAIYLCGVSLPLALTGFALWWAGVFANFWFWTFTYASGYEQQLHFSAGLDLFRENFPRIVGPNLAIWIIALAGLALVWWRKQDLIVAIFATGFLVFSLLAVCPGFYFRNHYFILMLPAIALLAGAAVSTVLKQWPRVSWLTYGVFGAVLVYSVVQQQDFLFRMSPLEISRAMYLQSPFPEAIKIADYIRSHTAKDARIAILGSEPEIPFYANRLSASGYIYMYGLMEPQPYAVTMQDEFISDIESSKPDYVVFVMYQSSWMQVTNISSFKILHWWAAYQPQRYKQLVGVADILADDHTEYRWDDVGTYKAQSPSVVLVYKRTDPADDPAARLNRADALKAQEKLDEAAQENLQVFAITLDPKNYYAHNNLGILLYSRGLTEEALKEFRLSLDIKPDQALVHHVIGKILTEKLQIFEAVKELAQAMQLDPTNAQVRNDLGVALFKMGDYENAAQQFSDAIDINPADAEARRNLALAQAKLKNKK